MAAAATLPMELIVDILSYLPVKCICRFKCVSKSWLAIIADSQLAKIHLSRSPPREKHLLVDKFLYSFDHLETGFGGGVVPAYPVMKKHTSGSVAVEVYESCNGLFCITPKTDVYLLFNPSTRESKKLPYFQPTYGNDLLSGFGFIESIDDYKFVKVLEGNTVHVFSLRNFSWKVVGCKFLFDTDRCIEFGVPLNGSRCVKHGIPFKGKLHWVLDKPDYRGRVIAAFDLVKEKFKTLSLPPGCFTCLSGIGVVGDCLCVFDIGKNVFWVMKKYGKKESWTQVSKSDLCKPIAPSCFLKNSDMVYVARYNSKWTFCYEEEGKKWKDYAVDGLGSYRVHRYVESVVSPNYK
ncbi:hypothetical protein ACOSP7_006370 [Xanthoceras sorbifolium]|uniref:F-box domain-containing protein n=1 Tax=Xanthoceras sorbifolium TaxID=99658 RepID=A0ABQ8I8T2_9ROSI|nr:hypothetical protein JRO89_XS03G0043200 [Xanthoceras sorbifolium]